MKKIILSTLCALMCISMMNITNIKAAKLESTDANQVIAIVDGSTIVDASTDTNTILNIVENNAVKYSFVVGKDGNIYMIEGMKTYLAISIDDESLEIQENKLNTRASSSDWILKTTQSRVGMTINLNVIQAGTAAIMTAIVAFLKSKAPGLKAKLIEAGLSAVEALAISIAVSIETYKTNVIVKQYQYNGCDWLYMTETELNTGTTQVTSWKDNPSLGIAPYVCKRASYDYPY